MVVHSRGKRVNSEMNVVPYIDVMLVLLVIFMISAPLINQSIDVNLPKSNNSIDIDENASVNNISPLVISINENGAYFIDRADNNYLPVSTRLIKNITAKVLDKNPKTPIYIRADKKVNYGSVMVMMDILKSVHADSVGLITDNKEGK